jgi:hypothetical protein
MLKQLLYDLPAVFQYVHSKSIITYIVTENVLNKLQGIVRNNLIKNNLFFFASCRLQFLLYETRTVLITAEFYDITKYILRESSMHINVHD